MRRKISFDYFTMNFLHQSNEENYNNFRHFIIISFTYSYTHTRAHIHKFIINSRFAFYLDEYVLTMKFK